MPQYRRCTITLNTKHKPRLSVPYAVTRNLEAHQGYTATVSIFPNITVSGTTLAEAELSVGKAVERFLSFKSSDVRTFWDFRRPTEPLKSSDVRTF